MDHADSPSLASARPSYVPAVPPRLRRLLRLVLALLAVLAANSIYLSTVTVLEWWTGQTWQSYFYLWMFLAHVAMGALFVVPFAVFVARHVAAAARRRNRRAVRVGYALLGVSVVMLVSGVALTRLGLFELKAAAARDAMYWTHVITPLAGCWLYVLHRLAGPRLKWRSGARWALAVAASVVLLVSVDRMRLVDPPASIAADAQPFAPSLLRTADGGPIDARVLMMDEYCRECHADVYETFSRSVHKFSSFNNKPYLTSVKETRERVFARDGTMQASRWCAGCHDLVPLLSGAFDRPDFDLEGDTTSHAGITCTVCHAVTAVNSPRGNADLTIAAPTHYPFTFSSNRWLQALNRQMIKAKPSFHKQTFLKPLHKSAEFCGSCHKVHLPGALTQYKDFLRGQNHYDSYLLSGVSGGGARSFYYPDKAVPNCAGCHMPLEPSTDFGARPDENGTLSVHSHLFPGANTAIAHMRGDATTVAAHQQFLQDRVRIDLFGLRDEGRVDGRLTAPLRPSVPTLARGRRYLLDTVIRTLTIGHHLTQGTADSNEVWVEVAVTSGGRTVGRSGALDSDGAVDPWAHFVNVFMLDRHGQRIDRRNAQDIFVPLYDHQIPPGAAQVVHYALDVPPDAGREISVEVKLQYRKFDRTYMRRVLGGSSRMDLPITTLARDRITFPVDTAGAVAGRGQTADEAGAVRGIPEWQRWNDYGIALLLEGTAAGERAELRQAADAFRAVERLGRVEGSVNLARVYHRDGQLDAAADALRRAAGRDAAWWTLAWLGGNVARDRGELDQAIELYRAILTPTAETRARGFDFSRDYEVLNALGMVLIERAAQCRGSEREQERQRLLGEAIDTFGRTIALDPENVTAHYNLAQAYAQAGDEARADTHRALHARYKPDENARDRAVAIQRRANPAADHAAQAIVIYELMGAEGHRARERR